MASRTYVPTLRVLTKLLRDFVNRNREKIQTNVSPEAFELCQVLLDTADALLTVLGEPDVNP